MPHYEDEERPRRRRDEEDDDADERPRRRRRRDDVEDTDDDFEDRRPRRRNDGDGTGGLIPYKNASALSSYYCGVFSLIPCAGLILGTIAIVLGFKGLAHARKYPENKGKAHAIVGIVLGSLVIIAHVATFAIMFGAAMMK